MRYSEAELRSKMERMQADVTKKLMTKAEMTAEVQAYKKHLALQDKADALELKNRMLRARLEAKALKRLRQGAPVEAQLVCSQACSAHRILCSQSLCCYLRTASKTWMRTTVGVRAARKPSPSSRLARALLRRQV